MRFQPPPGFARYPSSTGNRTVSTASREAFASEHHSPFPASTCRPGRAGHDPAHLRQRRAPPRPLCARTHVAPLSPGCGRSRPEVEFLHSAQARRGGAILGRESPQAPLPRDSPRQATPLSGGSPAQSVMRGPYHALWPPLASPFADRARSGPDPPRGLGAWRSHKFFFGPSTACTWGGSPWKCASNESEGTRPACTRGGNPPPPATLDPALACGSPSDAKQQRDGDATRVHRGPTAPRPRRTTCQGAAWAPRLREGVGPTPSGPAVPFALYVQRPRANHQPLAAGQAYPRRTPGHRSSRALTFL